MPNLTNQPLLAELSEQQMAAVRDGADAIEHLTDFRRRTFDLWMTVARGVAVLCTVADRPNMSRKARQHLLRDNGYGTLNAGTVSRLLRMAENETAIRTWRDTLTENKRQSWNSPTAICNRCPPVRRVIAAAAANRTRTPRQRRNATVEVERAVDLLSDHMQGLTNADLRASLGERLIGIARQGQDNTEQQMLALVEAIENRSIIEAIRKWRENNRTWECRYDMAIDLVQPLVGKDWMGVVKRDDDRQREAGEIISMHDDAARADLAAARPARPTRYTELNREEARAFASVVGGRTPPTKRQTRTKAKGKRFGSRVRTSSGDGTS